MSNVTLLCGDNRAALPTLDAQSADSIVTDPPYGLNFMGRDWDHGVPGVPFWEAALRVAKPGAHLLAFGGTRTFHRLACAIEDAGWEIRDTIMWVYGSGFPKSLDVSKAIDRAAGAEREVVGLKPRNGGGRAAPSHEGWQRPWMQEDGARDKPFQITAPATSEAERWRGWGTALKPAWEPIIVARKPLDGTVAANVLAWGTGAINVDACRVETLPRMPGNLCDDITPKYSNSMAGPKRSLGASYKERFLRGEIPGRWPANVIHDGSDEVVGLFPVISTHPGTLRSDAAGGRNAPIAPVRRNGTSPSEGDTGSAARFFYCAKASKADRDAGLSSGQHSHHPTVKPTALMRYLVRLVTPPGGVVLDPFMGSGSTGKAAVLEGCDFVGIEQAAEYMEIARARIGAAQPALPEAEART